MTTEASHHTAAWVTFTQAAFAVSLAMIGIGIAFAPIEIWIKAYFGMAGAMLVQSSIVMTKTLRDVHEGKRLMNRIEDARTERLLMGIERQEAA
jgi:hypothetical protein